MQPLRMTLTNQGHCLCTAQDYLLIDSDSCSQICFQQTLREIVSLSFIELKQSTITLFTKRTVIYRHHIC